jgi:hypothetical protein
VTVTGKRVGWRSGEAAPKAEDLVDKTLGFEDRKDLMA